MKKGFTQDLFISLNPPFPPVRLEQFDGCKTGDKVALELNFLLFKQKWVSEIVEDSEDSNSWYFIDQGIRLPFFLRSWSHKHLVKVDGRGAQIVDDITFSTGTRITDMLMYPLLLGQFMYRKPIYKRMFDATPKLTSV